MYSVSRTLDMGILERAGIDIAIIGNGSPGMIKSYRSESVARTSAGPPARTDVVVMARHLPHAHTVLHRSNAARVRRAGHDAAHKRPRTGR